MAEYRLLLKDIDIPDIERLATYAAQGGYQGAERALQSMSPEEVLDEIEASGLQGRGGDWQPVAARWRLVPEGRATYLCVNANESAPGLFRDRKLIERHPHLVLEGILLAAYALRARRAYIYIRAEMGRGRRLLEEALAEARAGGWLGRNLRGSGYDLEVCLHLGAGAYIAGEESALLASIEGRRAEPQPRPLLPACRRLFGAPAVVANVGTLAYLPYIVGRGAARFRRIGTPAYPGTLIFCLSGHVRRPGLYELELGSATLGEIVHACGGGVRRGRQLKAVLPGGARAPALKPEQLEVRMSPEAWAVPGGGDFAGSFGNGAIVVADDSTCMVDLALNLMRFYARESCGQCTPCRAGAAWLRDILARLEAGGGRRADLELLQSLCAQVSPFLRPASSTLCAFGPDFAWTLADLLETFRAEFEAHVEAGACPVAKDYAIKVPESVHVRF